MFIDDNEHICDAVRGKSRLCKALITEFILQRSRARYIQAQNRFMCVLFGRACVCYAVHHTAEASLRTVTLPSPVGTRVSIQTKQYIEHVFHVVNV